MRISSISNTYPYNNAQNSKQNASFKKLIERTSSAIEKATKKHRLLARCIRRIKNCAQRRLSRKGI